MQTWFEDFSLDDGQRLRMRPLVAADKQKLVDGLLRLSPQSRYFRFFTEKTRFTDAELAYLTEVDGDRHVALGIARLRPDGTEGDGVAVGRYVRLPDAPQVAEAAVAVIDDMQGRGLGRRLLRRLIELARDNGVAAFRMEFLALNRPMKDLLAAVSSDARFTSEGSVVVAEFALSPGNALTEQAAAPAGPDETTRGPFTALREWLRLVADGAVAMRQTFATLLDPEELRQLLARLRPTDRSDDER